MSRVRLGDQTRRFLGVVTLAKPEPDAMGDPVRKVGYVVFVTRLGSTVLTTSAATDVESDGWPVSDSIEPPPIFNQHPAAVAGLCAYSDNPCPKQRPVPNDDRDQHLLPTRESLLGVVPDPVPGGLITGTDAAKPFGCRQASLASLRVISTVRRDYTGEIANDRLVVNVARFADQRAARSGEVLIENWMGDCRVALNEHGFTTPEDYSNCRPRPLTVRRGDGMSCYWKYFDAPQGEAHPLSLAAAMVRVADRIVFVDRVVGWGQGSRAPAETVAQAIAAALPGARRHRPTYQVDNIADPPVQLGTPMSQLDSIMSLVYGPYLVDGCLHVPLRAEGTEALVDKASRIVTGYTLGAAGMTPRGLSVYSTLKEAQAAYPAGREYTTDDGRGDITHSWISTTRDGTEIDFATGPSYGADGQVVGSLTVHAARSNACRGQAGEG